MKTHIFIVILISSIACNHENRKNAVLDKMVDVLQVDYSQITPLGVASGYVR